MRVARVIGTVTLNRCHPSFEGATLKMAVPLSLGEMTGQHEPRPDFLVVWDQLGAGIGSLIAVAEGAEAAAPFLPERKPVGAYNAAILDHLQIADDTDPAVA